jgi:RecJ-like exonuclease
MKKGELKPKPFLLNEYAAAALVGMSPQLLRWFTSYAPKQGIDRKLKKEKEKDEVVFFKEDELLSFNEWLKQPWPHENGRRPSIPTGIRREVKLEANGACAICNSHKDTCEAAHLDPVAKTSNNHPENLLWLCANHHTAYDDGVYGPVEDEAEFVRGFKNVLHRHKRMMWRMQDEVSQKLYLVLETCDALVKQLEKAVNPDQIKAVQKLAKKTLAILPSLAPVSKADPKYEAFQMISADIGSLSDKNTKVKVRLLKAQVMRSTYVAALGYVACPLCKASGAHDGYDCPVCGGDREISESRADAVVLSDFEKVACPLCEGQGRFQGDDCPECGGAGKLEARYSNEIDLRRYEEVDCPLCKGQGTYGGEDCPVCHGDRTMKKRYADVVDIRDYYAVKCPLCKGSGRFDGEDCPACNGDRELDRRYADQIDLGDYAKVECPVCKGNRHRNGDDCRACDGDGEMQRRFAEQIGSHDY